MPLYEEFEKQGNLLFRYRGTIPIPFLIFALIIHVYMENLDYINLRKNLYYGIYYEYFCLIISLLGLVMRVYIVGCSAKNTSGRNEKEQVADTINTTGMYSLVRHPLYLANFIMWFGPILLTRNFWFVIASILLYWLYYERIMFAEEEFLRKKFGQQYLDWASKTPAFIPNFKNFKKSELPFSWKKVIRQEKNGLIAMFLVFLIFDIASNTYNGSFEYNQFYIIGSIVAFLGFLIIRYLKHKTQLLKDDR